MASTLEKNKKIKLLLIEDNLDDVKVFQNILKRGKLDKKFDLESAESLKEGLLKLKEESIDIVICDLGLSDSEGIDTFIKIKENAPETPAIVLSGLDDSAVAMQAVEQGAQDFLVKGEINSKNLERIILYAIQRNKLLELMVKNEEAIFYAERSNSLNTMLIGLAHNLNNPLSASSGLLELARHGKNVPPDIMKKLDMVQELIDRLGSIVYDMLHLGKSKSDEEADVDFGKLVRGVLKSKADLIKSNNIVVKTELEEGIFYTGRLREIEHAFSYVLQNAIEAVETADGKSLIFIKVEQDDSSCAIEVKDNGIGMSEEVKKRAFDPFFTVNEGIKAKGLGLSVALKIIQRYNGTISLESEAYKGTLVILRFPK